MSTHAYTEDQLVEQPAIGLFAELGWQTVSPFPAAFLSTPVARLAASPHHRQAGHDFLRDFQ